ncbi:MAG: hypothetical protein GYA45_11715 [Pelolinea sp.]|nr:hypothetical protein [Pelolinea sp.]
MSETNRTITSAIRSSESFSSLNYQQRDFWHGLIAVADDQGRLRGHPQWLKSAIWPYDDVPIETVNEYLNIFSSGEDPFIHIYEVKGKKYIQIVNWWKYQRMTWAGPSALPAPNGWTDRMHYHGKGNAIITLNWNHPGGFTKPTSKLDSELDSRQDSKADSELACSDGDVNGDVNDDGDGNGSACADALLVPSKEGLAEDQPAVISKKSPGLLSQQRQRKIFQEALGQMQQNMPKADFDTWMRPLKLGGMVGNTLRVITVNSYGRDWIKSRASPTLERILSGLAGTDVKLAVLAEMEVPDQVMV